MNSWNYQLLKDNPAPRS